jgi:enediyne biosynthesis protein E4
VKRTHGIGEMKAHAAVRKHRHGGGEEWRLVEWIRKARSAAAALVMIACLPICGCGRHAVRAAVPPGDRPRIWFTDVAAAAGVHFKHTSGQSGRMLFPETLGSGCALLDYNGDQRPDLLLVNSTGLPGYRGHGPHYPALYRNCGPGPDGFPTFEDVTRKAGLAVDCYGMGAAVGDYDNDGHPDLYLTAMGPGHLFHNNGDGTFTDVTRRAGVGGRGWGASAAWVDYDRDGRLDLVVGNYCRWTLGTNQVCRDQMNVTRMCPPAYYQGEPPACYHNNGDGTFTNVATAIGLGGDMGKTLGIAVWDEDGDGWPDLFFADDGEPDRLFRNRAGPGPGGRRFVEGAIEAGLAYGANGHDRSGMGADTADFENNGVEALAVGNFAREGLALYLPDSPGHYTSAAAERGLFAPSLSSVTFGVLFCDVDMDGYRDLVTTNGHIDPSGGSDPGSSFKQRTLLFHNEPAPLPAAGASGPPRRWFREISAEAGPGLQPRIVGRGLAAGDLDGDGDPDLLITVNDGRAMLLRNDSTPRRHWLSIALIGTKGNRDGFGTRIAVTAGGMRQQAWRRSGSSYCSQSDLPVLFGLGDHDRAEKIELTWPDGSVQVLHDVKADQVLTVKQGTDADLPHS